MCSSDLGTREIPMRRLTIESVRNLMQAGVRAEFIRPGCVPAHSGPDEARICPGRTVPSVLAGREPWSRSRKSEPTAAATGRSARTLSPQAVSAPSAARVPQSRPERRHDREWFYYREGFLHLYDNYPSPGRKASRSRANPADQVGAEGRKRCPVSFGKQGLGRGLPVFPRVEINGYRMGSPRVRSIGRC